MAARSYRRLRPLKLVVWLLVGLSLAWGLANFASPYLSQRGGSSGPELIALARAPGPDRSLAAAGEEISLEYLQQFCPADPDPADPGLCRLEPEQAEALVGRIPAEALACWQQVYDYAFGPLADQVYFGGPGPGEAGGPEDPAAESADCDQGAVTVLVQPGFASQIQADNQDRARFQDILFIMSSIIDYEVYRTRPADHYSDLSPGPLSYYRPEQINAPGTWNDQPATAGTILSLSRDPAGPEEIGVDPGTGQLLLPVSGRWGDADQAGDPELLMIFHRAACRDGGGSPVAIGGLRRYVAVYRPSAEDGFRCHSF